MVMKYFVGEKRFDTGETYLPVRDILEQAGYSSGDHYLLAKPGKAYRGLDELVPIVDGAVFEAKPRGKTAVNGEIRYNVNGEPQVTAKTELAYEELLRNAGPIAGIDLANIAAHDLYDDRTGTRYRVGTVVPIKPGDEFLAVYRGKTPVA